MNPNQSDATASTPSRHGGITRGRVAKAFILLAMISIALSLALESQRASAENYWQSRLVRGEPVVLRFICGTETVVDCKVSIKVTYQKQASNWCENLERSDQGEVYGTHWCNASPEQGTISIFGAPHSFDRFGVVKNNGRLVGQLFQQ